MARPAVRSRALALAGAATLLLLSTACSGGGDDSTGSRPDNRAVQPQEQIVRTPEAVSPDLPYTEPPLVIPLPGASSSEQAK